MAGDCHRTHISSSALWQLMSASTRNATSSGLSAKPIRLSFRPGEGRCVSWLFRPKPRISALAKSAMLFSDSSRDRPWSQYYCCMLAVNAAYAEKYPVATKRVVRAILKSVDICANEPEARGTLLVSERVALSEYDYALQSLRRTPLRQLARIRSRGYAPVLRTAAA